MFHVAHVLKNKKQLEKAQILLQLFIFGLYRFSDLTLCCVTLCQMWPQQYHCLFTAFKTRLLLAVNGRLSSHRPPTGAAT